jgi:hypothetical protein
MSHVGREVTFVLVDVQDLAEECDFASAADITVLVRTAHCAYIGLVFILDRPYSANAAAWNSRAWHHDLLANTKHQTA